MPAIQKLTLYNTLSHKKDLFQPLHGRDVGYYTCGPTVYQYAHIGNLRTYIFEDILKRTLVLSGYRVKHIMNITDVGHLTSDEDTGEDKVEKEATRQKKTAEELARFYEDAFKKDLKLLNILSPDAFPRATEHIEEQIRLIKTLEKKGYAYKISDGVYFDTKKFKAYGALWKTKPANAQKSERIQTEEKKNEQDFALWKFSNPSEKRQMEWDSPWGKGFPGWHIECSAMSMKYLGEEFDIHAGGIDHIPVHHTNELAQSEAATGKQFVRFWLHGNFLQVDGKRMGKSEGNLLTLDELYKKGFHALDYRYFVVGTHYRSPLLFSLEALAGARAARHRIVQHIQKLLQTHKKKDNHGFRNAFTKALADDLNTPQALAAFWDHADTVSLADILWADKILGLGLQSIKKPNPPKDIKKLARQRDDHRKKKEWKKADELRDTIQNHGWLIDDTPQGPVFIQKEIK
ncbi:MAG: cysteine--tRNA ligase [Candidatus Niyogibacteria bacterium CG10_big_fil_rev_8_21_14_0_10_46_36]|uniref:Cysteine--tRNA ligase n=1 Tax=Candidatus Niyogibacteria bacterium CG10_big_fil_rev_8_21_14_0_10_46_36 TaxID=1974726 RepID=A0A2H0TE69_9BACT|nr:MAG: cysteine--tRNA ligase [Candidatus Niyogibacteria bacterium CG10_big_fil_rev_8_21_14_0_10_46_36]